VQELWARDNRIVDEGLPAILSNLLMLQVLCLSSNCISHLPPLPWLPHLLSLSLSDNPLSTLSPLLQQPALRKLDISFCHLSIESVIAAVHALPSLTALQLNDNSGISDPRIGVLAILHTLPWLREINLTEVSHVNALEAAKALAKRHHHAVLEVCRKSQGLGGRFASVGKVFRELQTDQQVSAGSIFGVRNALLHGNVAAACAAVPDVTRQVQVILWAQRLSEVEDTCTLLMRGFKDPFSREPAWTLEAFFQALLKKQQTWAQCRTSMQEPHTRRESMRWKNPEYAMRWKGRRAAAALIIQRAWRGTCNRVARRASAAIVIQAVARGVAVRRNGELVRRRAAAVAAYCAAATAIQAAWRGYCIRKLLLDARASANAASTLFELELEGVPVMGDAFFAAGEALGLLDGSTEDSIIPRFIPFGLREADINSPTMRLPPLPQHVPAPLPVQVSSEDSTLAFAATAPRLLRKFQETRSRVLNQEIRTMSLVTSGTKGGEVAMARTRNALPNAEMHHEAFAMTSDPLPKHEQGRAEIVQTACTSPAPSSAVTASVVHSHDVSTVARRVAAVKRVQQEWGFQEQATAERYLKSIRHRNCQRGIRAGELNSMLNNDPSARLKALRDWQFARGGSQKRRGCARPVVACPTKPKGLLSKHLEQQDLLYCDLEAGRKAELELSEDSQTCSAVGIGDRRYMQLPPPARHHGQGLRPMQSQTADGSLATLITRVMHGEHGGRGQHEDGDGEQVGFVGAYPVVGHQTTHKKLKMLAASVRACGVPR
jgi:hypothetical protein